MNSQYICVHGHFYQPPRENAWLEAVEMQESAYPDHDWNERITRECYATNAKARLLDGEGRIKAIVSNYSRMSFNFGPTLLAWMKESAPRSYAGVLEGDRQSMARFGGHGSALAQGYNHAILPLCNDRDRRTQVQWGIRDFEHRFGRRPEGMWMPETAADTATLEALAEGGIRFTIMAPRQCDSVRPIGQPDWHAVHDGVDPTRAYKIPLPSGRSIVAFFYDGPVSQGVAFEGLLNSGDRFADRLLGAINGDRGHPQLMHIATDGESYGHHHRHGEMALAAAFERIERQPGVDFINYGLFLEKHPPEWEARIHENSSWSCAHGIERWRSDCGCNSGRQGFHQRWRAPLRSAFDWLRDSIAAEFEKKGKELFKDPWAARESYIEVILDRSSECLDRFIAKHAARPLSEGERTTAIMLMELQRHAMLMYTSCAWFFDDVAGIETVQVIQYGARVVQLARQALRLELEAEFLHRLEQAEGSMKEYPNGKVVYEKSVRPAILDLMRVGAHYALQRMFEGDSKSLHAYEVKPGTEKRLTAGRTRLVVGHASFRSRITEESVQLSYGALHLGDHNTSCGIRLFRGDESFAEVVTQAERAFDTADFSEVIRALDREFGNRSYNITSLFRDEQHAVVRKILEPTLAQIDASYQNIYEQHAPLARFLRSVNLTVPRRIQFVGAFVLSQAIRKLLEQPVFDVSRASELVEEARREGIELDEPTIAHAFRRAMDRVVSQESPVILTIETLRGIVGLTRFLANLPFNVDVWPMQEAIIERIAPDAPGHRRHADSGSPSDREWLDVYRQACQELRVIE
ncbi:MAG: DUF3536 domain-containing protein [Phycisphaeraceae bacterium]|nr:DUF3536 domain-containing protein [Phycisphaeraceae bacterium]